jgi:hypothetical protein
MGTSVRKFTELPLQNQPALGQRVICDIPTTSDLENVLVIVSGVVTLTTGAALYNADGILNLFTAVELIGDGRDTIVSLPMAQVVNGNIFRRKTGLAPLVSQPGVGIAANAWSFQGYIDLAAFAAIRPKDSSVRENSYKTLQLAFRMAGDYTSVYAAGFVATTSTFALTLLARECIEETDPATKIASSPVMRPLQSARDDQFSGAVKRQRFRLTPEQGLRGICLKLEATTGALSDGILDRVRVYVGKDLRLDMAAASVKAFNNATGSAPGVGYYFLDFADGEAAPDKLNDALDLRQVITQGADSYIEYDTLAAGSCNVAQYGYVAL